MKQACLLVTHGSRDPRHTIAAEQLRLNMIQQWTGAAIPIVGRATLELGLEPLHQQILTFVAQLEPKGFRRLPIVPVFLLAGTHVMEEIPEAVAEAQRSLSPGFTLELCPHIGRHPDWGNWFRQKLAAYPVEAWIVVSHGSRRASAQADITALVEQMGASSAYWSMAPSLGEQIEPLVRQGIQRIGILPFFLFPGGITDALQHQCYQLESQYPGLSLHWVPEIATSAELARFTLELLHR